MPFDGPWPEAPPATPQEHVERISGQAQQLAVSLSAAVDAGVSPALILPQLMLAFRAVWGEMPADVRAQLPELPA